MIMSNTYHTSMSNRQSTTMSSISLNVKYIALLYQIYCTTRSNILHDRSYISHYSSNIWHYYIKYIALLDQINVKSNKWHCYVKCIALLRQIYCTTMANIMQYYIKYIAHFQKHIALLCISRNATTFTE